MAADGASNSLQAQYGLVETAFERSTFYPLTMGPKLAYVEDIVLGKCAMGTTGIQKISFALLIALIIYVALVGG